MRAMLLVVSCWLVLVGPVEAGHRYAFRHFGDEHGLANPTATCLLQDRVGFLWVGTQDGLYRYDGLHFQRFSREDGLPSALVDSLYEAADGTLWVGTSVGVARREGQAFRSVPGLTPGLPNQAMAEDAAGHFFVVDGSGLRMLNGERFEPVTLPGRFPGKMSSLGAGSDGTLWIGGAGRLGRLSQGRLELLEDGLPPEKLEAILVSRGGEVFARAASHLVSLPKGATRFVDHSAGLPPSNDFGSLFLDRAGELWVPTDFGLAHLRNDGGWDIIGQAQGLSTDGTLSVLQDREGLLWVGLAGAGLDCWLGYPAWTAVTQAEGLNNDAVWAVSSDAQGALWVGTDKGLNRLDPSTGRWQSWGAAEGLGGQCAYTFAWGPDGALWIGLFPGGIARFDPRLRRFTTYGPADGLGGDRINALALTPDGTLWAASDEGLYRSPPGAGRRRFEAVTLPEGAPDEAAKGLHVDRKGRLWVGSIKGVGLLEAGRWRRFTTRDGLRASLVAYFAELADGSLRIGYWEPLGISKLTLAGDVVHVEHLDRRSGLASDSVQALAVDGLDRLWIGTSRGVNVVEGDRLRHYSHADGLICANVNTLHAAGSGGLWIGTSRGLAHFEPRGGTALPPPTVVLLSTRLGGRAFLPGAQPAAAHPDSTFEVQYAGLSFRKPDEVRFRYRLEGLEEQTTETAQHEARYPRLAPGDYTFEVESRNEEGAWSIEPARFQFRVLPPWYRTPFALGAGALFAVALAGLGYRARVQHLLSAQRELEEAVRQRTQELAREKQIVETQAEDLRAAEEERLKVYAMVVHDLKNPLTPIIGGLDFLEEGLRPDFRPGQQALESMRQAASRMLFLIESYTSSLRGRSAQGQMRWRGFRGRDLVSDLALSYAPAARKRGLKLSVSGVPVDDRWFPARGGALVDAPAETVYRVLENILGNALKYAASEIRLSVEEDAERVCLAIENDGVRISETDKQRLFGLYQQLDGARPGTGVGLASARRQVEELRGEIRVVDPEGSGVRFEVSLPRAPASADGLAHAPA